MDKEELASIITDECNSMESFLLDLRERRFDETKYKVFRDKILTYGKLLGNDELISRQVVGCVFDTMGQLESLMHQHHYKGYPLQNIQIIEAAHAELWEIVQDLFNPPAVRLS